jgi:hypothetical protein
MFGKRFFLLVELLSQPSTGTHGSRRMAAAAAGGTTATDHETQL